MYTDTYSREEMAKRIAEGRKFDNAVIISFYDTVGCEPLDCSRISDDVFYVKADDLYFDELADMGITVYDYFPDSIKLAQFIIKAHENGKNIICQCEYGQGRSAGCLAAIREYFFHEGISVFADYIYTPNKIIYNELIHELRRQGGMMNEQTNRS